MPRVKRGSNRRDRRRKVLGRAKGYFLGKSKLYKFAREAVDRAGTFAYIGRKRKKRDFRRLWIERINAAARERGLTYSTFMGGLGRAEVEVDRRVLADLAVTDPGAFDRLVEIAREHATSAA